MVYTVFPRNWSCPSESALYILTTPAGRSIPRPFSFELFRFRTTWTLLFFEISKTSSFPLQPVSVWHLHRSSCVIVDTDPGLYISLGIIRTGLYDISLLSSSYRL